MKPPSIDVFWVWVFRRHQDSHVIAIMSPTLVTESPFSLGLEKCGKGRHTPIHNVVNVCFVDVPAAEQGDLPESRIWFLL